MPFDPTPVAQTEDLSFATGREGLRRLAILLRQPHKDFDFYFCYLYHSSPRTAGQKVSRFFKGVRTCGAAGCALGLAYHCWPEFRAVVHKNSNQTSSYYRSARQVFGTNHDDTRNLFYEGLANRLDCQMSHVTAEDVASAIDEYLATGA